jgi:hypothetical protein
MLNYFNQRTVKINSYYFFLEYVGELRIIVLRRKRSNYKTISPPWIRVTSGQVKLILTVTK